MNCQTCEKPKEQVWANVVIEREGIQIQLFEVPFYPCNDCQVYNFPEEVEQLIQTYVEQKKKSPDSPKSLFIHVKPLLKL